jgi:polysaccharide export outer membrane protein
MRFLYFTYLLLGLICICSSCAYKQDQILFEQKKSIPDSILLKNIANIRNYRIKPQDILQIRNLQNVKSIIDLNPKISNADVAQASALQPETYQVDDDGTVALTGLGHVPVAGLTRQEAAKKIEDLYSKEYLNANGIILELKIINLNVTILGEIKSQGNYALIKDKTTLIELIGQAGGLTDRANEKDIKVIRNQNGRPLILQVDLSDIISVANPVIMQSGDVVYITENNRAIRTDKNQNFTTLVQPGLLVFSTILLIFSLVRR